MARDPSLHIKRSDLIRLIEGAFNSIPSPIKWDAEKMADHFLVHGKSFSVPQRSVYANNNKLEKKVEKLKLASRSNAGLFAKCLLYKRRQLKHRGIQLIRPADPEWLTVKDITNLATEFCNEFGMIPKVGYPEYIEIGLSMMNFFSVSRFKTLHQSICNRYDAIQEIRNDRYPNRSKEAHSIFMAIVSEKTGLTTGYEDNPDKFRFFVRAANEARGIGVGVDTYIRAQFSAFEWKSAVPEPSQLAGVKAKERVMKYCFENEISVKHKSKDVPKVDFSKIKKHGKRKGKNNNKQSKM